MEMSLNKGGTGPKKYKAMMGGRVNEVPFYKITADASR